MAVKIDGNGPITGSTSTLVTGMYATFMLLAAPPGWIAGQGQTMGNTGSGATLTGSDYLDLFTAWWSYSDAQLPILTSAGAASTRGASAAADWAALKRLTVFDVRDYFVRSASATNINGTKYTDSFRDHTHTVPVTASVSGTTPRFTSYVGNDGLLTLATGNASIGAGTETRPMNIAMLGCFKL